MANTLKEEKKVEKAKKPRTKGAFERLLSDVMDGSFLSGGATMRNVPFALFICFIAALYIANTYNAERTIRSTDQIGKDLKELQSEYISLKSELMYTSNQSQIAIRVSPLELQEAEQPPHKIFKAKAQKEE